MVSDFDKGRDTKKFFRIQIYDTFYLNIGDRGYYCFLAITAQDWTRKDRTGINQMELLTDRAEAANFYDLMETYYVDASWSPNSAFKERFGQPNGIRPKDNCFYRVEDQEEDGEPLYVEVLINHKTKRLIGLDLCDDLDVVKALWDSEKEV